MIEAVEKMGIDVSVALACLYQLQSRGESVDDLHVLVEEINNQQHQRECSVCLYNPINSLYLPCR
jgi:thymidylate synthase